MMAAILSRPLLPTGDRARVVMATGMALAAVTLACAVLLVWNDRTAQIRDWSHSLSSVSTTLAAHAEQTLRAADLVLDSVQDLVEEAHAATAESATHELATRAIFDGLRERVSKVPQVTVAAIVSIEGDLVNSTRVYPPVPINMRERDFFKAITAAPGHSSYLSQPVQSRYNGEWTFYLARPVYGAAGELISIVVAGIESRFFNDFYKAMRLGDDSVVSLFRTDGVLLAREPIDVGMLGHSVVDTPAFRRLLQASDAGGASASEIVQVDVDKAGQALMTSPRRVSGFPVLGDITVPQDILLAGWRRTAGNVLLLTFGLVMAVLSLTFVLARLFDRQDRTLRDLLVARQEAEDAAMSKTVLLGSLHASQAQLTDQSNILQVTLENIDQGLMMVAADGTVPLCNRRAMELLGLPESLMATRPSFRTVVEYQRSIGEFTPVKVQQAHAIGAAIMMTTPQTYERTRPNGTILEINTIPLVEGGMVRTFTDITSRRDSEHQIRFHAHHDGLTELVNRMVFQQELAATIAAATRMGTADAPWGGGVAVHYLDLDGFKLVNDTHGHAVGDQLLVEVAARLRRAVRSADTVGRMGGDEFAILQPVHGHPDAVEQLAQRVLAVISEPYDINDLYCTVGVSIGISLFPDHSLDAEDLLRQADMALYRAKGDGKGGFSIFNEAMDRRRQNAFQIEQALNQAIPRKQLFLDYQPIVDAETLKPMCYEALVRWRHPEFGVVPPNEFIGIAERSGLIVALGGWVLETACCEAARWPAHVGLSVNVSPVQFSQGDLASQVRMALHKSGLAPHRLTLEVTEGVLLEETDAVLDAMSSLRDFGVRFSLDDFGTEQSRLAYLTRFPFDTLKIDRSFVRDAVEQEGARAIVSALLAIGKAFHLDVIAEGIELTSQLDLLRAMGCDFIQGYLTGRPAAPPKTLEPAYIESKEAKVA